MIEDDDDFVDKKKGNEDRYALWWVYWAHLPPCKCDSAHGRCRCDDNDEAEEPRGRREWLRDRDRVGSAAKDMNRAERGGEPG